MESAASDLLERTLSLAFMVGLALLISAAVFSVVCNSRSRTMTVAREKAVFITGCDSGIGFECAVLCDRLGFTVFAGCLFPGGDGAKGLLSRTSRLRILDLDVTDEAKVQSAYNLLDTELRRNGLWGLINNAGVLSYGAFDWLKWEQIEKQVNVNLIGTIRVTRTFLPLIKKGKGRIVTMSSINGLLAYPLQSIYCATKFALEGLCNSLRHELRRNEVHVICLQLGDFAKLTNIMAGHEREASDMWNAMSEERRHEERDYFWHVQDVICKNCGMTSPESFENSSLHTDIRHALMSLNPHNRYMCMPFKQRLIFRFILLLPSNFADALISFIFAKMTNN